MTAEQLIQRLREFLANQSGEQFERQALRAAFNLRDQVRQRVQTRGIDSDGRQFASYVPDYARVRQRKGFQIRNVDYTRSGRLWGSIIPEVESKDSTSVTIAIGPQGRDNEVKLRGPGTLTPRKDGVRRGLPTLPSDQELRDTFEVWAEEVFADFEKTLGI